jgi:hypothetical protein
MDYTTLNEILKKEYKDVIVYVDLYKAFNDPIFKDIAREEMTHAFHIENILKDAEMLGDCESFKEQAKAALAEI